MGFVVSLLVIALMIAALVDIITREDSQVRFLPKMVWLIIVILLPLIGSALWFAIGREYAEAGLRIPRMRRAEHQAAPAAPTVTPPSDTRTTEQQIADLDREIEEWRLRDELNKRKQGDGEQAN